MSQELAISIASFAGRTGRGVRVAVVDSGIHGAHPHVGGISGGTAITETGDPTPGTDDRLGHGTAVAAAIREKAADCSLIAVRVFDRTLSTTAEALAAAIRWAALQDVAVINLSLGTANAEHAAILGAAVQDAADRGAVVIAAAPQGGLAWLPGGLEGVVAVEADWACRRDAFAVQRTASGRLSIRASGHPRPIPGIPAARNFKGPSFAVANATGLIALAIEGTATASLDDVARALIIGATS